jgi:hypothetical protein
MRKEYYELNRDDFIEKARLYRKENQEKISEQENKYEKIKETLNEQR